MQHVESEITPLRRLTQKTFLLGAVAMLLCVAGCGGGTNNSSTAAPKSGPPTYFAPYVANTTNAGDLFPGPNSYLIDDSADTFSQTNFFLPLGPQVINAGVLLATSQRGLLSLGLTANYTPDNSTGGNYVATTYPKTPGSFAVEFANQAGGLVQIAGQPAVPLVAAQCPNLTTAQTYQFITIPGALVNSATTISTLPLWDPAVNTAYGSVDITSDGTNVTFNNIQQYTLPSVGGTGLPAQPATSPVAGICGPTVLGNTISVPGQLVTTNPGVNPNTPPQATIGIGPTGLLVEDNGFVNAGANAGQYENVLGNGTGAVGLPKPSSALDTGSLTGAQYLGFVFAAGSFTGSASPAAGWSSHLASFGFSSVPSNCASVAASTSTLIYGGDYPQLNGQDNPSASPDGYGNCDLAIDFGTQDPANNGRFPNATVWLGASYAGNMTGKTYSFPAVAIAGQLNGKYAIFVLGVDSTQPWAIYLLQSN
jgi:hypothetical protein